MFVKKTSNVRVALQQAVGDDKQAMAQSILARCRFRGCLGLQKCPFPLSAIAHC